MKSKSLSILLLIFLINSQFLSAQCTSLALPFTETFSGVSLGASCSWSASTVSSGAGWMMNSPAYAGSTAPEARAFGSNACAGCVQTVSLTLASPLNTSTVTSLQLSFLHKLYVTNQATSGSGSGILKLQTSADGITWTDRWSQPYTVSGTALTSIASGTINVPAFNPGSNDTYIRFAITGVMFKVWGWLIDDVSATSPLATSLNELNNQSLTNNAWPNPALDLLTVETGLSGTLKTQLFNVNGQLIKELEIETTNSLLHIPISDLAPGIYFTKITASNGAQKTVKFLKS